MLKFYRCYNCKKLEELTIMTENVDCKCGGRRYMPSNVNLLQAWIYMLKHPKVLKKYIKDE